MSELFRAEALAASADRAFGRVVLMAPVAFSVVTAIVLLLAAGVVAFVFLGSYARKETVSGYITTDKGVVQLRPTVAGFVKESFVSEGARVSAGERLFEISTDRGMAGGMFSQSLLEQLREEARLLRESSASTAALSQSALTRLSLERDAAERERAGLAGQARSARRRLDLVKRQYQERVRLVERALVPRAELERLEAQAIEAELTLAEILRAADQVSAKLARLAQESGEITLELDRAQAEAEAKQRRLQSQIVRAESQSGYLVRAPVAGTIAVVLAPRGAAVQPGRPLAILLPEDARFEARLLVPTRSAGFLEEGQPVRIRYDAFPFQKFGVYAGNIEAVSRTVLRPGELDVPIEHLTAAYLVDVTLARQRLEAYGEPIALQAGMTLRADILRDRRQIIEWLFEPMLTAAGKW